MGVIYTGLQQVYIDQHQIEGSIHRFRPEIQESEPFSYQFGTPIGGV